MSRLASLYANCYIINGFVEVAATNNQDASAKFVNHVNTPVNLTLTNDRIRTPLVFAHTFNGTPLTIGDYSDFTYINQEIIYSYERKVLEFGNHERELHNT